MNVEEKAAPRCVWELYGKAKGNSRNLEYEEPKYQGKKNKERARVLLRLRLRFMEQRDLVIINSYRHPYV